MSCRASDASDRSFQCLLRGYRYDALLEGLLKPPAYRAPDSKSKHFSRECSYCVARTERAHRLAMTSVWKRTILQQALSFPPFRFYLWPFRPRTKMVSHRSAGSRCGRWCNRCCIPEQDDLGDRYEGIILLKQGLRGVEGGVVEEDDGPGLDLGGHPPGDLVRRQLLPVQTVHVPLDGLHAQGPDGGDDLVVVLAVGRPPSGPGPRSRRAAGGWWPRPPRWRGGHHIEHGRRRQETQPPGEDPPADQNNFIPYASLSRLPGWPGTVLTFYTYVRPASMRTDRPYPICPVDIIWC